MKKGICFLDFDGVINTLNIEYKNNKFYTKYYYPSDKKINNKQAILWVSKLCIEHNLDIYITSSWRSIADYKVLNDILYNSGLINEINIIKPINNEIRNKEINQFLYDNPIYKDKYVILDDERGYYIGDNDLYNHLVLCDSNYGFVGAEKYSEAIKKLYIKDKVKTLK